MKIKRFVAPDMRQAMRDVREEQGPDAVILSTRRLADGIEIIAAVDYDESLVREAVRQSQPAAADDAPAARASTSSERPVEAPSRLWRRSPAPKPEAPVAVAERVVAPAPARPAVPPSAPARIEATDPTSRPLSRPTPPATAQPAAAPAVAAPAAQAPASAEPVVMHPIMERAVQDTARMRAELGSLREMLESQLSSLAWNDMERRHPLRARVLREMTRLGIDADVARQLADGLPEQISPEQARYLPLGMLSRSLATTGRKEGDGGITALVGPTGVGKTTTIAKLAARAVVRHGAGNVALVSTDHYRIGAAAQLEHYGRLLGVRVYPADDAASLRQVLQMLKGKHTVLVDTAGVSGTDPRLEQQMDILNEVAHHGDIELRICLVLAANAQAQALEESTRAYMPLEPTACILTKLDEAPSLGGALSVLIRHRVPLDYTTDGQRVPEDIAIADARVLVLRAANVLKSATPAVDDGIMAERFGFAVATA
jgi:flagellar biosynthesis protein FlhF